MTERSKKYRPRDTSQLAKAIVDGPTLRYLMNLRFVETQPANLQSPLNDANQ
jgi:hypothetical protein